MFRSVIEKSFHLLNPLNEAADAAAIETALKDFIAPFGLPSIFGGILPDNSLPPEKVGSLVMLRHGPQDWRERYLARGYLYRDPIFERLQFEYAPFTWHEAAATCKNPDKIATVGAEAAAFGLRGGFVVPMNLAGGHSAAISFGGSNTEFSPSERSLVAFVASHAMGLIIQKHFKLSPSLYPLSPRERECLQWASEGKTNWEISQILGVSEPTVIKHLLSSREKLGAVTKSQAIANALRQCVIT